MPEGTFLAGHAAGASEVRASSSTWCYADPDSRREWGDMWADRITNSAIAHQLLTSGLATSVVLRELADAWHDWAASSLTGGSACSTGDPDPDLSDPKTESSAGPIGC